jgi:hypothetical protein
MLVSSSVAAQSAASQEGLSSMSESLFLDYHAAVTLFLCMCVVYVLLTTSF